MKTYTFSFTVTESAPEIMRRPWWNIFGRDEIVMRERQVRRCISDIPESEAAFIMNQSPASALIRRIVGRAAHDFQLEQYAPVSAYIKTSSIKVPESDAAGI